MCKFKVGDIVRLKDSNDKDYFYKIVNNNVIKGDDKSEKVDNSEKVLKCELLGRTGFTFYMESAMQKVTFYEMLDYIKDRTIRLIIKKPNWVILNCLTEGISYIYNSLEDNVTFYYQSSFLSYDLYVDFDNLDFEKDLKEIELKEKINETLDVVEGNLKDAFKKVIIYGEEVSFNDILDRLKEQLMPKVEIKPFVPEISFYSNWKSNYINIFNMDKEPKCIIVAGPIRTGKTKTLKEMYIESMKEDSMTREQVANAIKDMFRQLNKKEQEDEVFINVKNKTTVIKWADGDLTKVTYDPRDEYKQTLEKGVLICALRKYMTTGEINKELKWSHTNEDIELGILISLAKQYFTVDKLNELINKAMESQERDLKKYRKKSNREVKKTLMDNTSEKPTNPKIGIKIKKKKEE